MKPRRWRVPDFATCCMLLVMSPVLLIGGCKGVIKWQVHNAKKFCEALVPHLEQVKTQTGRYPETADTNWWAGKELPSLIYLGEFYHGKNDGKDFIITFREPWAMDNVWAYDTTFHRGKVQGWINYDANPRSYDGR